MLFDITNLYPDNPNPALEYDVTSFILNRFDPLLFSYNATRDIFKKEKELGAIRKEVFVNKLLSSQKITKRKIQQFLSADS